jgi:hypothetical protein
MNETFALRAPRPSADMGSNVLPAQDFLLGPEEALLGKLDDFLAAAVPTSNSIERAAALQGARVPMSQISPIPILSHGLPFGFIEVLHDDRIKKAQVCRLNSEVNACMYPYSA